MKYNIFKALIAIPFVVSVISIASLDNEAMAVSDLSIHDIQGDAHQSPYNQQHVDNVEGIVTYQYENKGQHYIHIQTPDDAVDDDPNTSEGLIVFTGKDKPDVQKGDLVHISGLITEYAIEGYNDRQDTDLPITELDARAEQNGAIDVIDSHQPLPKAIKINHVPSNIASDDHFNVFNRDQYAIDFWESLEGMRVEIGDVRSVGPEEHGDIFTVLNQHKKETQNGGIRLQKNDSNGQRIPFKLMGKQDDHFDVKTGDQFHGPLIGHVGYGFQNYKVLIDTQQMEKAYQDGKTVQKGTQITPEQQKLTMASYNLENFSNNTSSTSDQKAKQLANGIVTHLKKPDIIGVTEVQDNNGPDEGTASANESYERLIQMIEKQGGPTYDYVNIDPENNQDGGQPDANIRVGFLYNPNRVTFNDDIKAGDATTAVHYKEGQLTRNPGRISPNDEAFDDSRKPLAAQFDFNGEQVIAIVNHWNSKGGDDALFGKHQLPQLSSETQRGQIAELVCGFVDEVQQDNANAHIISVGDYNDFQWSNALKTLTSHGLYNMVNTIDPSLRYSYVFQGNSQTLDHILVSDKIQPYTTLDMVHVNSDFTEQAGRASDHDPLLAQIDFGEYKATQSNHDDTSNASKNTTPVIDQKKSDGQYFIQQLKPLPQTDKDRYKAQISNAETFGEIEDSITKAKKENEALPSTGERFATFGIILGLPLLIVGIILLFKYPRLKRKR